MEGRSQTLSPEQAKSLTAASGYIVCHGVPLGTEIGVDYMSFQAGKKFKGVKMVPPGLHLLYSCTSDQGYRSGFFCRLQRQQVFVRTWDAESEELGENSGMTPEDEERHANAVRQFEFDSGLGPYAAEGLKTWHQLTHCITDSVLTRCGVAIASKIMPSDPSEHEKDRPAYYHQRRARRTVEKDPAEEVHHGPQPMVPFFDHLARTARFTALYPENPAEETSVASGAKTPEAITQYHMDGSDRLQACIDVHFGGNWKEFIGEVQLAFVLFFLLGCMAALNQWKRSVSLLCSCETAMARQPRLFTTFLRVLRSQLKQAPADMFPSDDAIDSADDGDDRAEEGSSNFLPASLRCLFILLRSIRRADVIAAAEARGASGASTAGAIGEGRGEHLGENAGGKAAEAWDELLTEAQRLHRWVEKTFRLQLPAPVATTAAGVDVGMDMGVGARTGGAEAGAEAVGAAGAEMIVAQTSQDLEAEAGAEAGAAGTYSAESVQALFQQMQMAEGGWEDLPTVVVGAASPTTTTTVDLTRVEKAGAAEQQQLHEDSMQSVMQSAMWGDGDQERLLHEKEVRDVQHARAIGFSIFDPSPEVAKSMTGGGDGGVVCQHCSLLSECEICT